VLVRSQHAAVTSDMSPQPWSYGVDAALMSYQQHDRGIHARRLNAGEAGVTEVRFRCAPWVMVGHERTTINLNPRPARPVFPVVVSAAGRVWGSDEETGVRRTNAGLDRPRLYARGRARQAPCGSPPDARPLVPVANGGVPAPEVAAMVFAGPAVS
jgi:hypothetical protein